MARLIVAFIRHGDYHQLNNAPSAFQPFDLNDDGRNQAFIVCQKIESTLQENGWQLISKIDSSQLLRAWQTANIMSVNLSNDLGKSLFVESFDALAERCVGSVANLTVQEIEKIVDIDPRYEMLPAKWKSDSHFRLPFQGAESLLEAGSRVAKHVTEQMALLQKTATVDSLKLFVGHGAAFRHAAYHLGVLEFEQIKKLSMFHAHPVYLEYDADGQWKHIAGEWKVRDKTTSYTD